MKLFSSITFLSFLMIFNLNAQKNYKSLMKDISVNFYDVCDEAEKYFETHDPAEKGSGWKGYQRWRHSNEYKFYPDGNRDNKDPHFAENAFRNFKTNNIQTKGSFDNGWKCLGPYEIDSVTGGYAPGLGRVEDHYVNPINTNLMYLGTKSGGFWKTNNGGENWQVTTDFLIATGVNTIAVSPTNPDSVLINVQNAINEYSHGVFRSIDGGETWNESNFNIANIGFGGLGDNFKIFDIAYHPTKANVIYVSTSEGIYKSEDNLQTWDIQFAGQDINEVAFHPTDPEIIYMFNRSNRNRIYYSINGGNTYFSSALINANNNAIAYLSVSKSCSDCVYYASDNGVWKSSDKGQNFVFHSNPNESCRGFAVNDLDDNYMIYGYVDIRASSNNGLSFNKVTWWYLGSAEHGTGNNQFKFDNSNVYVHPDLRIAKCIDGIFYIGTDGLFCKSEDNGLTWTVLNQGTAIKETYNLGLSQSNHHISISGSQDNGTSIKHENDWIDYYGADGMEGIFQPLNPDWLIGSTQYGGRRRSKDGGQTSHGASPPGQSGSGNAYWVAPLAYNPNEQMQIFNFSESVYRSDDFGTTWEMVGSPFSVGNHVRNARIAENNSDIMVVARYSDIRKSVDGGLNFTNIKNNLPNYTIEDIAFNPSNDDEIVVVYGRYQDDGQKVFITKDGGNSWENITFNLNDMPIRSVVIDHTENNNIYLGAEIGIFTMPLNGTSWSLYNTSLANTAINELEINYGSNTLKAATWGRGLWENSLVGRNDFPSIITTTITNPPTDDFPKETMKQFVISEVQYDDELTNVLTEWSLYNPTFENIIEMDNIYDDVWKTKTPIPDFDEGTKIFFRVSARGENDDVSHTYKFMYTIKPFVFCDAFGSNGTTSDYINKVTLNDMTNTSGKNSYSYFKDDVTILDFDFENEISIQLENVFSDDMAGVWVDFNRNAQFEESEAIEMSNYNTQNISTGKFMVPEGTITNDTLRMRVRNSWNAALDPCGVAAGEVEDYPVIVLPRVTKPDLLEFNAEREEYWVNIDWETNKETNNDFFTMERSLNDTLNFQDLDVINGAGNSYAPISYDYVDMDDYRTSKIYYRLKKTDFNQKTALSKIVNVEALGEELEILRYSRANDVLSLWINSPNEEDAKYNIFNLSGKRMNNTTLKLVRGIKTYQLDLPVLSKSIYFSRLFTKNRNITKKIIINK